MKFFAACLILLSTSQVVWAAGGDLFSFKSGSFDSKHFPSRSRAGLEMNLTQDQAHLTIVEGICAKNDSFCQSLQRSHLDQTFRFIETKKDACNVKTLISGNLPSKRAFSKMSKTQLMMAKVEVRDPRLSTCADEKNKSEIQVIVHTKTTTSVGTSTLQFEASQTDVAMSEDSGSRARTLVVVKGSSTLMNPSAL